MRSGRVVGKASSTVPKTSNPMLLYSPLTELGREIISAATSSRVSLPPKVLTISEKLLRAFLAQVLGLVRRTFQPCLNKELLSSEARRALVVPAISKATSPGCLRASLKDFLLAAWIRPLT